MFVHLHCHSHYSFLRGVNPPEEIIAAAVEQKMSAVALTDTNGMYAAVPFYQAARAAGVKPIVGVTLEVERSGPSGKLAASEFRRRRNAAPFGSARGKRDDSSVSVPMVLLAADAEGYSNLCQLTTLRHLGVLWPGQETFGGEAGRLATMEELAAHSAGVVAVGRGGEFLRGGVQGGRANSRQATADSHQSLGTSHLQRLKGIFGERLYIEVQHLSAGEGQV